MEPITLLVKTDPDEIAELAFDYFRGVWPGWRPIDGDLTTEEVRAHARMIAEERDTFAQVSVDIYRYGGEKIDRLAPIPAARATVAATVTMRDDAGYRVDAGLEVLVKTTGDDGVAFTVAETVVVPRGRTATEEGEVTLVAAPGYEGLDDTYDAVPIRAFDYITSVELVGRSSGGADAETPDAYLARLAEERSIASPSPINTPDFAILYRRIPGVARALAFNLYQVKPEIISLDYSGSGTGTLTDVATGSSVSLTSGATAASIETAFEALTPSGNRYAATASGGPLGTAPIIVELSGREEYGPWRIASSAGPTVSVELQQHGADSTEIDMAVGLVGVDVNGEGVGSNAKAAAAAYFEARLGVSWSLTFFDPTYTAIDVAWEAVAWPDADPAIVREAGNAALAAYLSPATWGTRPEGQQPAWADRDSVDYLEIAAVLNGVPGLDRVTRLQIGVEGRALGTADIPLPGPAPLARPGSGITGTVREG